MAPDLPLVTAAILAYNRRDPLATTLEKLAQELDYPAELLEVIVVDNASTDGTAEMVRERFPDVHLIAKDDNDGIAGWNRAFEAGRGEYFLVLDDDCYVAGDALRRAIAAAREHAADLVSFSVESSNPDEPFSDDYRTGVLSFWGCSVLVSRRAIQELGGFDVRLFIWAHEVEFTMRLLDRGMTHVVLPEVRSVHMKHVPGPVVAAHQRNMHNFGYVAAKLLQPRDAFAVLANLLLRGFAETAANRDMAIGPPAAMRGFRAGFRIRTPVRRPVSRLYRRHFLEFVSHLRFVRGPRERWHDLRNPGPAAVWGKRQEFWAERPALYPTRESAFRVP